jgi:CubicO group peptidase (beta-lactamase class C family)
VIVPSSFVADTLRGAPDGVAAFVEGDDTPGFPPGAHYRNCWWVRDPSAPYFHASGIYGQNLFVHVPTETVVVKLSTWPRPLQRRSADVAAAAVEAIGAYLSR